MSSEENTEKRYRVGLPPDAQHEYEAQRDAAGGSPNRHIDVPPAIGDIAYGGATNAATILHEALEKLIPLLGEAGVAYQQVIVASRVLSSAQTAFDIALEHRDAFESELETWGRRPRVGGVDPQAIHPGWTPTLTGQTTGAEADEPTSRPEAPLDPSDLDLVDPTESGPNPAEEAPQ